MQQSHIFLTCRASASVASPAAGQHIFVTCATCARLMPRTALARLPTFQGAAFWPALITSCANILKFLLCRYNMLTMAGMKADRVTFNTLLKCCMRSDLPDKAMQLFREMVKLQIPVSPLYSAAQLPAKQP